MTLIPTKGHLVSRDLESEVVHAAELNDIIGGVVDYFHCGIECSTWSVLRYLNGAGTRSPTHPMGDGHSNAKNKPITKSSNYPNLSMPRFMPDFFLHRAASVVTHAADAAYAEILRLPHVRVVLLDMCMFGLGPPPQRASS